MGLQERNRHARATLRQLSAGIIPNTRPCVGGPPRREAIVVETGHRLYKVLTKSSTSSACPGTLTPRHSFATLPSPSMTNVLRSMPRTFLPYMFFILMTPNSLHSFSSASETSSKGNPIFALNPSCDLSESREHPTMTAPSLRNSG